MNLILNINIIKLLNIIYLLNLKNNYLLIKNIY